MTKILLPFLLVFSSVFAQVNENIIGNWRVSNITINGETLAPLNLNAEAYLNVSDVSMAPNYQSEPCSFDFSFTSESSFVLDFPNVGFGCLLMPVENPPHDSFQEFYYDFFPFYGYTSENVTINSPINYDYVLSNFEGFTMLTITKENGDVLNAVMFEEEDDFFETWVLSSVTYQNQTFEPSPTLVPATLLFNFTNGQFELNLNYCNDCYFPIEFVSEDEFVVLNNQMCTLMLCENEAFQPVLGIYENGFWQNIGVDNPYTFVITTEGNISTLTITNPNDDVMIFNIIFASNPIHENPTVDLHPNPVQEALFLSSTIAFENYQIFDFSGKMIQKGPISMTHAIDVQGLPKGMYVVHLENQNTQTTLKFLKE